MPRTAGGALVGAFLAVSGAIMQGMTRNALASPEIMGVTNGSAFCNCDSICLFPGQSSFTLILWSFCWSRTGCIDRVWCRYSV
ncbi:iron chelate uptake ABC transporter family permease subunit [Bacillus sp. SL00103]